MSTIKLVKGSCVDQKVDAIVNAANKNLWAGSGVCGAIFAKAGYEQLEDECQKIKTPLNDGDAVITSSCQITNSKKIIHAVGPDFGRTPTAFEKLFMAYYNSLIILKENNLHSISFPLISSGIYGYGLDNPTSVSTKNCIEAYKTFISSNKDYEIKVLLCAYTDDEYIKAKQEFDLNSL